MVGFRSILLFIHMKSDLVVVLRNLLSMLLRIISCEF